MKTVACTVRRSAGDLVAGDRTGGKTAGATRSNLDGVFKGVDATKSFANYWRRPNVVTVKGYS